MNIYTRNIINKITNLFLIEDIPFVTTYDTQKEIYIFTIAHKVNVMKAFAIYNDCINEFNKWKSQFNVSYEFRDKHTIFIINIQNTFNLI